MRLPERVRRDLATSTRFGDVRVVDEVDSTNRLVREEAVAGAPEGLVVVADHQTAGRGRLGRRWDAAAGTALLVSVLLRPAGLDLERLHLVTAAAGLAAAAACREVGGFDPELKWPNDLLVGDRKLAGILAERVPGTAGEAGAAGAAGAVGAVVVGIGCNVSAAPPGAVSAGEAAGRVVDAAELLVALLRGLDARCDRWDEVAGEYRRRCATLGRRVRVEGWVPAGSRGPRPGEAVLVGRAVGVDAGGRLLVAPDGGAAEVAVSAADVTHLRSDAGGGW